MDFIVEHAISTIGIETPQKQSIFLDFILPLINSLPGGFEKDTFIQKIAGLLGNKASFFKNINHLATVKELKSIAGAEFSSTIEGLFIRLLLSDPKLIKEACKYVTYETFTDQLSSDLFSSIVACFEKDPSLNSLIDSISDEEKKRIISKLFAQGEYEGDIHADLRHTILRLQRKFLEKRKRHYREQMKHDPNNRMNLLKLVGEDATQQKEIETPS